MIRARFIILSHFISFLRCPPPEVSTISKVPVHYIRSISTRIKGIIKRFCPSQSVHYIRLPTISEVHCIKRTLRCM